MKFYANLNPKSINTKNTQMSILNFNIWENTWSHEEKIFDTSAANNPVPISTEAYKCLNGHFLVEVKDINGVKGYLKLYSSDDIVTYGRKLHPGIKVNEDEAVRDFREAGMIEPSLGFDYIAEIISLNFNEGSELEGDLELYPQIQSGLDGEIETKFTWKIL